MIAVGVAAMVDGCQSDDGGEAQDREEEVASTRSALFTDTPGQWVWHSVPGTHCGNGGETGFGISLGTEPAGRDVVIFLHGGGLCFDDFTCRHLVYNSALQSIAGAVGLSAQLPGLPLLPNEGFAAFFNGGFNKPIFDDYIARLMTAKGVFDRSQPSNPFRNSTMVFIPYCTGDMHSGNRTVQWPGISLPFTIPVNLPGLNLNIGFVPPATGYFTGGTNLDLDIDAIKAGLGTNISQVTLTGSSAGGFGAMYNYPAVKAKFPSVTRVDMITDAGPILNTQGLLSNAFFQTQIWNTSASRGLGACTNCDPIVNWGRGYRNLYSYFNSAYPDSRFGFMVSGDDFAMQVGYANTLLLPTQHPLHDEIFGLTNELDALSRWRYFVPEGTGHTLLWDASLHSAGGTSLFDWLNTMHNDTNMVNWVNKKFIVPANCTPNCAGRECGSDGCGGVCGDAICGGDHRCGADGHCLIPPDESCWIGSPNQVRVPKDSLNTLYPVGGAAPPGGQCQICDPSRSTSTWSVAPNQCLISIDGVPTCKTAEERDATGNYVCAPGTSQTSWTLAGNACSIGGSAYRAGTIDPSGCSKCDPEVSQTSWTPIAGDSLCKMGSGGSANDQAGINLRAAKCASGTGSQDDCQVCYAVGERDDSGCFECDPAEKSTTLKLRANHCFVGNTTYDSFSGTAGGGICAAEGDRDPTGCFECNPAASTSSWTMRADSCFIDGQCYVAGDRDALGCSACDPSVSTTTWTKQTSCTKIVIGATNGALQGTFNPGVAYCAGDASPLGLPGTWKNMVSTSYSYMRDLVPPQHANKPVVNIYGQQVFPSWSSIFNSSQVFSTPLYSMNGGGFNGGAPLVWTGATAAGTLDPNNCGNFTSTGYWYYLYGIIPQFYFFMGATGDWGVNHVLLNNYAPAGCAAAARVPCVLVPN